MNQLGETCKETASQGSGCGHQIQPAPAATIANPYEQTIKEYIPASWFHPVGIYKVLTRFWDRLPDVGGMLFLTFTLDPKNYANEETAFEDSRDWLRKLFFQLRHGVEYEGKNYVIDAPYCIKVEFHESGWVHYHVIFLTRRFLPKELLAALWDRGWVTVQRIANEDFHYLLKYVSKPDDLPEWVRNRKRLRVFQNDQGLLKTAARGQAERAKRHSGCVQAEASAGLLHDRRAILAVGVHGCAATERRGAHCAISCAVSGHFRSSSFVRCAGWSLQRQRGNHHQPKGGVKSMDTNAKSTAQAEKLNGLFVRGVVMSSTAKAHKRKDGTGVFVIARHELALQPGLALWESFHDPKDGKVKLDGETVVEFPKLPEFQQVTLKVLRWEERDKRLVIKDAEVVA
jgi:hypothetical protein